MRILVTVALATLTLAGAASAGEVYRGNWGGNANTPIAIEVDGNDLVHVCNFGSCGAWPYERDGDMFVLTNQQNGMRWTFEPAPGHEGYNAVFYNNGNFETAVAGARMDRDLETASLQ